MLKARVLMIMIIAMIHKILSIQSNATQTCIYFNKSN